MKLRLLFMLLGTSMILTAQQPVAPVQVVTDDYFGQSIDDPYRYLEDMKNEDVIDWFKAQGDYAAEVMNLVNGRDELVAKFKELDQRRSSRVFNLNITENDLYFYLKMTPEDEVGKLYMRKGYAGDEVFLFDPSTYNKDEGKQYTIDDPRLIAWMVEASLRALLNRSAAIKNLLDSPSIFPFRLAHISAEHVASLSPRLDILRHGLNDDLVMLRDTGHANKR